MHLAMVREDFNNGDTEVAIFYYKKLGWHFAFWRLLGVAIAKTSFLEGGNS
jgi:hypothetical protein